MNIILFDSKVRIHLLPLTFTRPVAEVIAGMDTITKKWKRYFENVSFLSPGYMKAVFGTNISSDNLLIDGSIIPNKELVESLKSLKTNQSFKNKDGDIIAARLSKEQLDEVFYFEEFLDLSKLKLSVVKNNIEYKSISRPWHIFSMANELINEDFIFKTNSHKSMPIPDSNRFVKKENIFIEEGAVVEFSILNASNGPIYISKNAEIMENCVIRGPFYLGENSTLKIGCKIYGPTSIGSHCKVGGEVNNSVFFNYSNKAHDGFIGNSVIGEWCNLGADTNNSNLKNTYDIVKLWSYAANGFDSTGLQFCGLIMGDHCKCGINTMFNTGSVIGVSCNLFGDGFHRNFIPSFSWGSTAKMSCFPIEKALIVCEKMMERRNVQLSDSVRNMLNHVFKIEQNPKK